MGRLVEGLGFEYLTLMPTAPSFPQQMFRQTAEVVVIVVVALGIQGIWSQQWMSSQGVCLLVMTLALAKTAFFFVENLQHILLATSHNIPYHRFLGLMGVNMAQITLSFALDYWCLESADKGSFSAFQESWSQAEILFECFFFSVLNAEFRPRLVFKSLHTDFFFTVFAVAVSAFSTTIKSSVDTAKF